MRPLPMVAGRVAAPAGTFGARRAVSDKSHVQISFSLQLPTEARSVPIVRGLCRDNLLKLEVERRCVDDIALAVTEACANVVANAQAEYQMYEVQVQVDPDWCHIRVTDSGRGFDVDAVPAPADGGYDESGRGIALMRSLVERIAFESRPEKGMVAHLQKRLVLSDTSPLRQLPIVSA